MGEFDGQIATMTFGDETYQGRILETRAWFTPQESLLGLITGASESGKSIRFIDDTTNLEVLCAVPAEGLTIEPAPGEPAPVAMPLLTLHEAPTG